MKIKLLGTGTSTGVPLIGCKCEVCLSSNPLNKRLRTSAHITLDEDTSILIDTGPDLRQQCLRENITRVDFVLYTHFHSDHVYGIDDLRAFNFLHKKSLIAYADNHTFKSIKKNFDYCFSDEEQQSSVTKIDLNLITHYESFNLNQHKVLPIKLKHGKLDVTAYRIGNFAYLTDCSEVDTKAVESLQGLDVLVIDGLRYREHSTHFTIPQAIKKIEEIKPKKAYLTHISHDVEHIKDNKKIKKLTNLDVSLAYDGLEINI